MFADTKHHCLRRCALGESRMNTTAPKVDVILGAAAYGGGFRLFGNAVAESINKTDRSLSVIPRNTAGSAENIGLLDAGKLDIALVAAEPAYEVFAGIGRGRSDLKIVSAIYSSPGMFAVLDDSSTNSETIHSGAQRAPPASDYLSCYLILIDMVRGR
jgi:TRAP-type uncharacterized transport system substrate-binding protein